MSLNALTGLHNEEVQRIDREYFKKHPKKTYFIREHLESESDIDAPYVLVVNLSEYHHLGRYPLASNTVSRQKLRQLKKSMKKGLQKRNRRRNFLGL
ncbi:hypothetical protein I4641_23570 [Waterburya agarophytonicola K14]|uniref:Uncharacterized protein n=1 Tax=Waterburya agarophytonicola KI4 TaxID=2874699 RepID=A0A964BWV8_9CYAN|nr:hypothetical protein [Waterburya agarophytonicola]MCC0179251.1 hypothetical protein [Waterburya agarophytonicola KI4]MCC0179916.1 hypothetical protein [Waterburya agarophytonicola KI4]